jgi:excisionase family DNA binding protein
MQFQTPAGGPVNQQPITPGAVYTAQEVAEILQLNEAVVRRKINAGEIAASNLGSEKRPQWRIHGNDLIAYLDARRSGTIILTIREVAELLKIDVGAVRRRCEKGELAAYNIGTPNKAAWRVRWPDLERYIAERANAAALEPGGTEIND